MFTPLLRKDGRPEVSAALGILLWPDREYRDEILHDYISRSGASVQLKDRFRTSREIVLRLNVNQFELKDITVNLEKDFVVIRGQHELKVDEHGYVSREFTRRFKIPEDVENDSFACVFHKNGLLTIEASKKVVKSESDKEIVIPVKLQQPVESMLYTEADVADEEVAKTGAKTPGTEEDAEDVAEAMAKTPVTEEGVAAAVVKTPTKEDYTELVYKTVTPAELQQVLETTVEVAREDTVGAVAETNLLCFRTCSEDIFRDVTKTPTITEGAGDFSKAVNRGVVSY